VPRLLRSARSAFGCCALALAGALACGGAPGAVAPAVEAAAYGPPLPPDAALTVRVDLAALGGELGDPLARQLLFDAVSLGESPRAAKLLQQTLQQTSVLWVAVPGQGPLDGADKVLLERGHFANVAVEGFGGWQRRPSGLDWLEVSDAAQGASGYARLYRLESHQMLVWASHGELAEVERTLARRRSPAVEPGPIPPERGAVSVAARPGPLLALYERRYPELVERFRGLRQLEAFAEPTAGTWRADVFLDFATAEQATLASSVVERLRAALVDRACAVGVVARALTVTTFERNLRLQAWLEGPQLESVLGCVLGSSCCV
jgi:hypothetical protein